MKHPPEKVETIGQLYLALEKAGFARDEYLSASIARYEFGDGYSDLPIYCPDTTCVVCYWKVGNNEGFYAFIDRYVNHYDAKTGRYEPTKIVPLITAKFWDWERAEKFVCFATRLINAANYPQVRDPRLPKKAHPMVATN